MCQPEAELKWTILQNFCTAAAGVSGILVVCAVLKRDSAMRFSTSGFYYESVSPKPLGIPLGPFEFF
jgi:hypothetical protein